MKQTVLALSALLIGGLTYVLFRSPDLLMFSWFRGLGLGSNLDPVRASLGGLRGLLPSAVLYSLPNELWVFSGVLILDRIWRSGPERERWVWVGYFLAIAFGAEVGQGVGAVPGTFDWGDMLWMAAATVLALLATTRLANERRTTL